MAWVKSARSGTAQWVEIIPLKARGALLAFLGNAGSGIAFGLLIAFIFNWVTR